MFSDVCPLSVVPEQGPEQLRLADWDISGSVATSDSWSISPVSCGNVLMVQLTGMCLSAAARRRSFREAAFLWWPGPGRWVFSSCGRDLVHGAGLPRRVAVRGRCRPARAHRVRVRGSRKPNGRSWPFFPGSRRSELPGGTPVHPTPLTRPGLTRTWQALPGTSAAKPRTWVGVGPAAMLLHPKSSGGAGPSQPV